MANDTNGVTNGQNGHATRPKVLQLGLIEHAHDSWAEIGRLATIITPQAQDRAAFLSKARSGAFDGCTVAYRTFESFDVTGKVDEEMLSALPSSLQYICHNGAGYDQVVVSACTKRGIAVSHTPSAVDDATADIGIFLMLGALRNLAASMASLRAGDWRGKTLPALGHDPQGKTLGILGMGGIGRNMARKAAVFGMKVRYYNRTRLREEVERDVGAEYVDFETLVEESDVLSLSLPLNEHTRHIISKPQFDKMKHGVVIVNTARGAVMDEAALVEALDSGKVYSAGLDVFEDEPIVHPGLLANPRVFLVPHMGTWTVETQTKMEEWTISNVRKALTEGKLRTQVPEQKHMA